MSETPFMPEQPNKVKAPLLVGTVILGIGMFLFSYSKYENVLLSLGLTVVVTGGMFFILKGFLLNRTKSRQGNRDFNPGRRKK